jgi:Tol biopolymer transport system component
MTLMQAAFGMALIAVLSAAAPLPQSPAVDLQRAKQREQATGDCKAVLAEYARIADESARTNRAAAAEALLRAAMCHESLKDGNAEQAYARVEVDFSDQVAFAQDAGRRRRALRQLKLQAFGDLPETPGPFKAIEPDSRLTVSSVTSPDGTRALERDVRGLVLRDLTKGTERILIPVHDAQGQPIQSSAFPLWSPDGREVVAFVQDLRDGSGTLRAIDAASGTPRLITTLSVGPPVLTVLEWTAAGEVLFRVGQRAAGGRGGPGVELGADAEFYVVKAAGGEPRKVFTLPSQRRSDIGNVAPDGRTIFVVKNERLVSIDMATGQERQVSLAVGPAYPRISPDGKMVAFLSRLDGAWALYVARLDQLPVRDPLMVARIPVRGSEPPEVGQAQGMHWDTGGILRFEYQDSESHLYRIDLDRDGHPSGQPQRLTRTIDGFIVEIAPDSARIAFSQVVSRDSPKGGLLVVSADGGAERRVGEFPPALQTGAGAVGRPFGWMSSNDVFIAGQESALLAVNVETGATRPVPNSTSLGTIKLFGKSRVGNRLQYLPLHNQMLYTTQDESLVTRLVMRDLGNGSEQVIQEWPRLVLPPTDWRVSPDETMVAYWGTPLGVKFEEGDVLPTLRDWPHALNIVTIEGRPVGALLTRRGAAGVGITWTPDSKRVLYEDTDGPPGLPSMRAIDVAIGQVSPFLPDSVFSALGFDRPILGRWSWSPDGKFVVFSASGQTTHRFGWQGVTYDIVRAKTEGRRPSSGERR